VFLPALVVSAACLLSIRRAGLHQPQRHPRRPIRVTIAEGWRYVAGDPGLRLLTIWAGAQNLFLAGFTALAVVYLVRSAGLPSTAAGLLLASGGIGGILGALAARGLTERYGSAGALRVTALAGMPFTLLIPLSGRGWHILFFLAGFPVASSALAAGVVILVSFRQAACPPELLGRVTATMRFLAYGVNPVGALLAGSLASWLGLRTALWIVMCGWVATGAFLLAPALRNRELPTPLASA
jgi:predicted MFS family arabinose efflux permease